MRTAGRRWVAGAWVLALAWGGGAAGQAPPTLPTLEPAAPRAEAALPQSLDLEALLTSPETLPASVGDDVWQIDPGPGRRLVQVPIVVEPGESPVELGAPGIDLRGGRFIAWRIVPDDASQQGVAGGPPGSVPTADSRRMGDYLLMDGSGFDLAGQPQPGPDAVQRQAIDAAAQLAAGGELAPGTPTFTRSVVVTPGGELRWSLERAIPGGQVKDAQSGYALKLRPELLAAREPKRPAADTSGGNAAQIAAARRQAEMQFRQEMEGFRELRTLTRSLPDEFETALPSRLWAVYEVNQNAPQLAFSGPAPLPWSVRLDGLEALRATAGTQGGGGGGGDAAQRVGTLSAMVRDNHPLTHRAAAMALSRGGLVAQAQVNDTLYHLLNAIIQGPDDEARQMVVERLATTVPPTPATMQLLREAAAYVSPELKLVSLRGLVQGALTDTSQLGSLIENANRTLADPSGPDAGLVLQALAEGAAGAPGQGGGPGVGGNAQSQVVNGVRFEGLPAARRDQAIAYVVRTAGVNPVSEGWLTARLLGSSDAATARRTYELLSQASHGGGVVRPASRSLLRLVFGEPPADGAGALDLRMRAPVPIASTSHPLFRGVRAGDTATKELAWAALPNFTVAGGGAGGYGPPQPGAGQGEDVVAQLHQAGLQQKPTPPQLATFLAGVEGSPAATAGLVELVLFGDAAAARQASRAVLGSERGLAEAMDRLQPDQRAEFAGQLYHNLRGRAPLVVGLLAAPTPNAELTRWFADAVASGELPEPAAWAEAAGSEADLLQLAGSNEQRVAKAAVAALVAGAGGDDLAAGELAESFAAMSDRAAPALASAWTVKKKEIFSRRLEQAEGQYRLVVRVWESDVTGDPAAGGMGGPPPGALPPEYYESMRAQAGASADEAPFPTQPTRTITVGVIDLNVEGQSVYLGNQTVNLTVPPDRIALQMKAADLKSLPSEELKEVPLERVTDAITLEARPDGGWRGHASAFDGTGVQVLLEPASGG